MVVSLIPAVKAVRDSVVALMTVTPVTPEKNQAKQKQNFRIAFGTAWCVANGEYFVTAYHAFNDGKPRDPESKHFLFSVPDNQKRAFHTQVLEVVLEEPEYDLAVLRIDPAGFSEKIGALPVSFDDVEDGTQVVTCGFPAPSVQKANITPEGVWVGGSMFLKSYVNTGIIAGQYLLDGEDGTEGKRPMYEFNVAWFQGESGGPICSVDPVAALTVMQHYRNVQTPSGAQPGPRRGISLRVIRQQLEALGATVVSLA